ncbi:MAG: hypothetical protein KDB23_14270, partial [Planctomycetales bacterium]|nr:hypothetical protein [Planctomycetales bacterium]
SATFAERSGSFVNAADRLQSFEWAIRPPAGSLVEGYVASRLLGSSAMYRPEPVLQEIAREISYFAAASGTIPPTGVDLRVSQLATG